MEIVEAISKPEIGFSGFIGAIVLGVFAAVFKIRGNPFRLGMSFEELLLMSSFNKLMRRLYIAIILLTGVSYISIFTNSFNFTKTGAGIAGISGKLFIMFTEPLSLLLTLLIPPFIFSLLCLTDIQKGITRIVYSNKSSHKIRVWFIIFSITIMFIYFIFVSMIYGLLINTFLLEANTNSIKFTYSSELFFQIFNLDKSIIPKILYSSFIYFIFIMPLMGYFSYISDFKGIVTVHLNNGEIFENKFLINGDIDNGIFIADSLKYDDPNKFLVLKSNIKYIHCSKVNFTLGVVRIPRKNKEPQVTVNNNVVQLFKK